MDNKVILEEIKDFFGVSSVEDAAEKLGYKKSTAATWRSKGITQAAINKYKVMKAGGSQKKCSEKNKDDAIAIPILKLQAGAGGGIYNFETQEDLFYLNQSIFHFAKNCFAIEIIGDSMEPEYSNGDYIVVSPVNGDRKDDGVYAIRIDGMLKIKRLQFKLDGSIDIVSINPNYPTEKYVPNETQVDFEIIGSKKIHISR